MILPEAAKPFDELAKEYDSWYDSTPLFGIELAAIRAARSLIMRPEIEIGVGPGRFAQALGIEFGLDPALSPLQLASRRSIIAINGIGEQLPIRTQAVGTIYLFFTFCFLSDPAAAIKEFYRALKPEGLMMIGMIPGRSPWGKHLAAKGLAHHPIYRFARFRTIAETKAILSENGFELLEAWSTLFQPPGKSPVAEHPRSGADEEAGFCVLLTRRKGETCENCQRNNPDH